MRASSTSTSAAAFLALVVHVLCLVSLSMAFFVPPGRTSPHPLLASSSPSSGTHRGFDQVDDVASAMDKMDVRAIMALLEQTYPAATKEDWTKTRRYLYQYRASSSSGKKPAEEGVPATKRKRRGGRSPLALDDVHCMLSFLQDAFPDRPELQAQILQQSPRILGRCHSIESRLVPTVEFLRGLYGGMEDGDGNVEGRFYEAIARNTDLLLVRGVGFPGAGGGVNGAFASTAGDGNDASGVEEYLRQEMGLSGTAIAKLKRNHPTLFQLPVNDKVKPVVEYLRSLLGHRGRAKNKVAKIVTHHPMLLQLDVAANLQPTARFLRESCGLSDDELATVVGAAPGVLGLSVEGNLRPTMQYLLDILQSGREGTNDCDADEEDASRKLLRKCVLKHPQVLALSLGNLSAKREYFDGIDRSDPTGKKKSLASRILVGAPTAYSLSLNENIIPKVEYLARLWGIQAPASLSEDDGDGDEESSGSGGSLSDNLREYPQILTLSLEGNIAPTLSFYNMTGYVDLDAEGLPRAGRRPRRRSKFIIRSRYIATSLYNRLLPRWHFLMEQQEKRQELETKVNEKPEKATTPKYSVSTAAKAVDSDAILPPLHLLAGASDDVFCCQMDLSLDEYLTYKEDAIPRLKFSSQFAIWLKTGRPIDVTTAP